MEYKMGLSKRTEQIKEFIVLLVLAFLTWAMHFWHFSEFGLYEDDFTFVSSVFDFSLPALQRQIYGTFLNFSQGRPICFSLINSLSYLGNRIDGLNAIYIIGYLINVLNVFLFYFLVKRISQTSFFAILGSLSYVLFAADTTQAFLTHALGVIPSITFLLIAFHLYYLNQRGWSYLAILGSLISYEITFPIFFAAPLVGNINKKLNSRLLREFFIHAIVMAILLVSVTLLRKFVGENRVSELNLAEAISTSFRHMLIGPAVSMAVYVYRPLQMFAHLDTEKIVVMFISFWGINWLLSTSIRGASKTLKQLQVNQNFEHSTPRQWLTRLTLIGCVFLVLAYPLSFTNSVTAIDGRNSRVHLAAVAGGAILFACVLTILILVGFFYKKKQLVSAILSITLTLLVGFGLVVQDDYITSWRYQKAFWTDLIQLIPDMSDETVIFVEPDGLKSVKQIEANTWNMPRITRQLYRYPNNWLNLPRTFLLRRGWQDSILSEDGLFQINGDTTIATRVLDGMGTVDSSNVIWIETTGGQLTRRTEPIVINEQAFPLKPQTESNRELFGETTLYRYLIEQPVQYLQ